MKIQELRIEDIIPYENNPRKNDDAVDGVAKSIKQFGFKVPIVIDRNRVIIAGHTRYKASKKLGLETIPCVIADDLTEEQVRAFRLADNKVAEKSEWDFDLLDEELAKIMNIDMAEFGFDMNDDGEVSDDDIVEDTAPDIPEEPKSKLGDIYQLGNHRLMCGDSTDATQVSKLMAGTEADAVVTDPPYNVDISNSQGMKIENDNMGSEAFHEFLEKAFANLEQALKPGGAFYIWHASRTQKEFETALNENNLQVKEQLIWVKNAFVFGRADYQWKHEPCFYGWKEGATHYFTNDRTQTTVIEDAGYDFDKMKKQEAIDLLKQIFTEQTPATIIHEDRPTINDLHPTMKPIKLMARLIRNSTKKNETVLDLFGGSGSTMIACEQLDRKCYMMEYDPKYVDVIIQRWEAFTGEKAVQLNG